MSRGSRMISAWAPLTILLLTACSVGSDRSELPSRDRHSFLVHEEQGVPVAVTSGGPKFTDELFTYEKVLEIDTEQHEDAMLYRPVQFMADDDGTMYIFDEGIGSILVFDAAGRYSHSIGRKGFGPGESSYGRILLLHDGIVQFYGLKERRTSRFSIDGELLDVTTVPTDIGIALAHGMIVLPDGIQIILRSGSGNTGKGTSPTPGFERSGALMLSAEGDSLALVATPSIQVNELIPVKFAAQSYSTPVPIAYGPAPMVLYHPVHGLVLSTGEVAALDIYTPDGSHARSVRIELDPEPVTQIDRTRAREIYRRNTAQEVERSGKPTDGWLDEIVEQYPFADEKAFWGRVEIDGEGYFWLDRTLSPEQMEGDEHRFLVLSPEGEYLGVTSRPFGPAGASVSGGRLYILEENHETGEMRPTVYRIVPAVRGLAYPN